MGIVILESPQTHKVYIVLCDFLALIFTDHSDFGTELDIAFHSPPWKEYILLEHKPALFIHTFYLLPVKEKFTFSGCIKPCHKAKKGCLSASARTEKAHELAVFKLKIQV